MNKRQTKKRDKNLLNAIIELNKMVAEDFEMDFNIDGITDTLNYVKSNPKFIARTFKDYEKYIVNKWDGNKNEKH